MEKKEGGSERPLGLFTWYHRHLRPHLPAGIIYSQHIALERMRGGHRYRGLCPSHNEKTPSFFVRVDYGTYKCMGCGIGGDIIDFFQKFVVPGDHNGIGRGERRKALRYLVERYGHYADAPMPQYRNVRVKRRGKKKAKKK
jgi:hypothetical protein